MFLVVTFATCMYSQVILKNANAGRQIRTGTATRGDCASSTRGPTSPRRAASRAGFESGVSPRVISRSNGTYIWKRSRLGLGRRGRTTAAPPSPPPPPPPDGTRKSRRTRGENEQNSLIFSFFFYCSLFFLRRRRAGGRRLGWAEKAPTKIMGKNSRNRFFLTLLVLHLRPPSLPPSLFHIHTTDTHAHIHSSRAGATRERLL